MVAKIPSAAELYEAALRHLGRYAATEAGLARVLARRVDRWARETAAEAPEPDALAAGARRAKSAIPEVIARLRDAGLLNDDAFAAARATRLTRAGKSRRATLAHLAAKGVRSADIQEDPQRELAAACAYLRRRRAGPFGDAPALKILGAMARGGFSQEIARRALALSRDEAEALLRELHS